MSKERRQLATSLFKALDLLTLVASRSGGISIRELVEAMSLPRTSVLRLLKSLTHYGFVGRGPDRSYFVTESFREWRREDPEQRLKAQFAPAMRRITDELGEMTTLGRPSGRGIHHVRCEEPDRRVRVSPPVGKRFAIETMAMGKLLLSVRPDLVPDDASPALMAELEEAKRTGFAMNKSESEEGIVAVAVWLAHPSSVAPLMAVTWPDFRYSEEARDRALQLLFATAKPDWSGRSKDPRS